MYWDPTPTVAASPSCRWRTITRAGAGLDPPEDYLRGRWEGRDWRARFTGLRPIRAGRAATSRRTIFSTRTISAARSFYRQPKNLSEVHLVLTAAWTDPDCAYADDGDEHWTVDGVREWWAEHGRLAAGISGLQRQWSSSERADERENAAALRDFARYLDDGLEADLREYGFWPDNRRRPLAHETLPRLRRR
jgi:hypothetical protein